jgi:hypothetical protein
MAKGCGPHYIPRKLVAKFIPEKVLNFFNGDCTIHDNDYNTYEPKEISDAKFLVNMWESCETVRDLEERKYYKKWALRLYRMVKVPIISHISWYSKGK